MSNRRGKVGIGKVISSSSSSGTHNFTKKAQDLKIQSLNAAVSTLQELQIKLEDFASTYQKQLRDDPAFRNKFFQMCAPLGIDVLCSTHNSKAKATSFWTRIFHNTSHDSSSHEIQGKGEEDFYNELSVKVAEVCIASRSRNGGIISVSEVQDILGRRKRTFHGFNTITTTEKEMKKNDILPDITKSKYHRYSAEEIVTAVIKLSIFGSMKTVAIGHGVFIQSVPAELDQDHYQVLTIAQVKQGHVTVKDVTNETRWGEERSLRAINLLLSEGMAWLDVYDGNENYWFPSIWKEKTTNDNN